MVQINVTKLKEIGFKENNKSYFYKLNDLFRIELLQKDSEFIFHLIYEDGYLSNGHCILDFDHCLHHDVAKFISYFILNDLTQANELLSDVSARTLGIGSAASVIKAMPLDQAIQLMKSDITGLPQTQVIDGELIVAYVR